MLFHAAGDPMLADVVLRVVQHSSPASVTGGAIAMGSPLILETATASLPQLNAANGRGQNFVRLPAHVDDGVEAAIVNNLLVGILADAPGPTLQPAAVGLAQCYGVSMTGKVRRDASAIDPGTILQPSDDGWVAKYATGSIKPSAGIAGLAILLEAVSSGANTQYAPARVFLRCM